MADLPGGTATPGSLGQEFFDRFGRQLALRTLSPGAGEGPTSDLEAVLGELFGYSLAAVLGQLAEVLKATEEEALCYALNIDGTMYRNHQELATTAATVVAARAGVLDDSPEEPLPNAPADRDYSARERQSAKNAGLELPTSLGVAAWTLGNVANWLCPEAASELDVWQKRTMLAQGVSLGSDIATRSMGPFISRTDRFEGSKVHNIMAERFRSAYGPDSLRRHDIVVERNVYARGRATATLGEAQYWGPTFGRLWLALRSPKTRTGHLRVDLLDLALMNVWEVKPIDSIKEAVAQLWYYTGSYNCLAQKAGSSERLFVSAEPLDRSLMLPVRLDPKEGRPRFAFLFQLKQLPGLVSYVAISLPTPQDMKNAAALELMRRFAKELRKFHGPRTAPVPAPVAAGSTDPWVWVIAIAAILLVSLNPAAIASLALSRFAATGGALLATAAAAEEEMAASGPTSDGATKLTILTFAGAVEIENLEDFFVALGGLASSFLLLPLK